MFNLTCLWNGTWDLKVTSLPTCEPLKCNKPPFDVSASGAELSYRLLINDDISLFGTTFKMECPENTYFINRIPLFEAVCQHDG